VADFKTDGRRIHRAFYNVGDSTYEVSPNQASALPCIRTLRVKRVILAQGDQTTLNNYDGMIGSKASLVDLFQSKSSVQVWIGKELGMVSLIRLQLKRVLRWQSSIALASLACSALRWIQ